MRGVICAALLLLSTRAGLGQNERRVTEVAKGVYAIEHEPSGNTTVIIGDRQVLVVDSGLQPSTARADIAQIRQWTDKPVSFVVNTHFHNDHNVGNRAYMDAFPAVTIIAHVETKKDMDMFGQGSQMRAERARARFDAMLTSGKGPDGAPLTEHDRKDLTEGRARVETTIAELKGFTFQSATLTFDHDFRIDLGNREVEVKFLGRGNTGGDAVVYLPKEKVVATGDLVVYPVPYLFDGYPAEWVATLDKLAALDAETVVPGHGPVMHDKKHILLIRDLLASAVEQVNARLRATGPALARTLDEVKSGVDLSAFRQRFAGNDKDLGEDFDEEATHLVKLVFTEASLR